MIEEDDLRAKCREVFHRLGLSKTEVSRILDVSDVAVHYMMNRKKGMSTLRKRFLDTFADMDVSGPGYLTTQESTLTPGEIVEKLNVPMGAVDEALESGDLPAVNAHGGIPFPEAKGFAIRYHAEEDDGRGE